MNLVVTAIVPTLLLLAGGACLRRSALGDEGFWTGLSWMSYWVFTPALFITAISTTDMSALSPGPLLTSLATPILAVTAMALLLARATRAGGPQLTSLVQGSIRINTYVGLIFASALHGEAGVATFALAGAVVVPLVNLISVTALSLHGDTASARNKNVARELVSNPLILACAIGFTLNVLHVSLPSFATSTLRILAEPALACGTLIAGAALQFTFARRDVLDVGIALALKLLALPALGLSIAIAMGVQGAALTSIVLICAVPTAPGAYVLAARLGGDTRLIAAITGVQTLACAVTMPIMLAASTRWG